jgi:hypothetical protein
MMMKRFGWLLLAAAVLAGCTNNPQTAKNENPTGGPSNPSLGDPGNSTNPTVDAGTTGTTAPATSGATPAPGTSPTPGKVPTPGTSMAPANPLGIRTKPDKNGTGVIPGGLEADMKTPPVKIDKDEKGWNQQDPLTALEVAKKMDQAFAGLKNVWVQSVVSYNVPSVGKLSGRAEAKIEDKDTFRIDYYLPETSGEMNRMVSDDGRSAYMRGGKWVGKKPTFSMAKTATDAGVKEWEEVFSERMFARFLTGQDGWSPIVDGWQKGKGGYKLEMEQKTIKKTGKKDQPFYRLLATRGGADKAVVEVRVDALKYLPVSIRVIRTNKDGTEESMYWNSQWKTGGTFTKKDFPVPAVKS